MSESEGWRASPPRAAFITPLATATGTHPRRHSLAQKAATCVDNAQAHEREELWQSARDTGRVQEARAPSRRALADAKTNSGMLGRSVTSDARLPSYLSRSARVKDREIQKKAASRGRNVVLTDGY